MDRDQLLKAKKGLSALLDRWEVVDDKNEQIRIQNKWNELVIESFPLNSAFYLGNLSVTVLGMINTKAYGGQFLLPFVSANGRSRLADPFALDLPVTEQLSLIPAYLNKEPKDV
ncbi:hypothetical protein Xen7305DRAFT_00008410 [Xenococcus sp. PCC 7305]|uniref:hypothetical protein n=1 Tax=Xenococcus sp. PCC 7305 TaxID=102125 RepID=UPI0002ACC3C4|nr:hypothetical protein [Xenococcus sp. PCC 7305]ELS01139.1 hypothetical protein Xen7305DRAFT_00008410 [Xenococcus sp. PCC 7305]